MLIFTFIDQKCLNKIYFSVLSVAREHPRAIRRDASGNSTLGWVGFHLSLFTLQKPEGRRILERNPEWSR